MFLVGVPAFRRSCGRGERLRQNAKLAVATTFSDVFSRETYLLPRDVDGVAVEREDLGDLVFVALLDVDVVEREDVEREVVEREGDLVFLLIFLVISPGLPLDLFSQAASADGGCDKIGAKKTLPCLTRPFT